MKIFKFCAILLIPVIALFFSCNSSSSQKEKESAKEGAWKPLFNGNNLEGWKVLGGDGNFYVENNAIVGETKMDVPNTFLATQKEYYDFILELDFKVHPDMNSGVQIRSGRYQKDTTTKYLSGSLEEGTRDWEAGRVHGYQIEIDPSDRAWTGGFYEEGGRGWLQPLKGNETAQNAFKQIEWNSFKIIAKGSSFKTYINGVEAANTTDDMTKSGFIGLQLHGINNEEDAGKKVMFKNIKIKQLE